MLVCQISTAPPATGAHAVASTTRKASNMGMPASPSLTSRRSTAEGAKHGPSIIAQSSAHLDAASAASTSLRYVASGRIAETPPVAHGDETTTGATTLPSPPPSRTRSRAFDDFVHAATGTATRTTPARRNASRRETPVGLIVGRVLRRPAGR